MVNTEELIGITNSINFRPGFSQTLVFIIELEYISLKHKSDNFIASSTLNLKDWMTTNTNYIILTTTLSIKKSCNLCFIFTFCLSLICFNLLQTCNCKQWPEYRQSCEKKSFWIDDSEDLEKHFTDRCV